MFIGLEVVVVENLVGSQVVQLPNARGEERSNGRVRTMLLLVASVLAIKIRLGPLASLETHTLETSRIHLILPQPSEQRKKDCVANEDALENEKIWILL